VGGTAHRDEAAACTHLDEINDKVHNFALVHGLRVKICDQKGDVVILQQRHMTKRLLHHIMAANAYRNRLPSQHNEALRALRKKPAIHAEHVRDRHVTRAAPHELLGQEIFEVVGFLDFDRYANAVD
jgi:hypothetical protein